MPGSSCSKRLRTSGALPVPDIAAMRVQSSSSHAAVQRMTSAAVLAVAGFNRRNPGESRTSRRNHSEDCAIIGAQRAEFRTAARTFSIGDHMTAWRTKERNADLSEVVDSKIHVAVAIRNTGFAVPPKTAKRSSHAAMNATRAADPLRSNTAVKAFITEGCFVRKVETKPGTEFA